MEFSSLNITKTVFYRQEIKFRTILYISFSPCFIFHLKERVENGIFTSYTMKYGCQSTGNWNWSSVSFFICSIFHIEKQRKIKFLSLNITKIVFNRNEIKTYQCLSCSIFHLKKRVKNRIFTSYTKKYGCQLTGNWN